MLRASDAALVAAARSLILARFEPHRHVVGCALRTRAGRVHAGVHLECHVGRVAVGAEAVANGRAATEGDGHEIETIVAVYCTAVGVEPTIVAPCGMCREMISDYAPAARISMPSADGPRVFRVSRLLPERFARPAPGGGAATWVAEGGPAHHDGGRRP